VVGVTTSGGYGHAVGQSLAFAYVEPAFAEPGTSLEVIILDQSQSVTVVAEPLYDAKNERLRV
jgi:dimethylglycine dehydrogenase